MPLDPPDGPTWRVYYDDDSTVDDTERGPSDVPARGVIAIARRDPETGFSMLTGHDFYWWDVDASEWFGGDRFGMYDYLVRPGWKRVLFGRSVTRSEYRRILARAGDDDDFPRKSGYHPDERNP